MSSFDLYRKKMQNNANCRLKFESRFILTGSSATTIHHVRLNEDREAALIISEKEGPDVTTVFTYLYDNKEQELLKRDYYTWKNNIYFVYEDIDLVREAKYKKQYSYQCNATFEIDGQKYYGYFVASLSKYVDTTLQSDLVIDNNDKPILIMPYFDWIEIGKKIIIKGTPWKIIDFDLITNRGIAYISLDLDFMEKDDDIHEDEICDDNTLSAGVEIEMYINYGYFKTDKEVKVLRRTKDYVKFIIPFGIEEITITLKDEEQVDISKTYKVV